MNILQKIKKLFHKDKKVYVFCKTCKQNVEVSLYDKKIKCHIIGKVRNKKGNFLQLYCNGAEL